MNVLMFTNTFTPHIGGVARSVSELARQLRLAGDKVLIVAPEFEGMPLQEDNVVRVPALQNFVGSDFSVPLPLSTNLARIIERFQPDVVHSHHPFLLGDSALRAARSIEIPVIYTFHTRYDLYGHYVAQESQLLKRLVQSLSLGYCDLCDGVVAPSESIQRLLQAHFVKTEIATIPTGVDLAVFGGGDGERTRRTYSIPMQAPLIGHVGRLAAEKNLGFLASSLAVFLQRNLDAFALIVGDGPSRPMMEEIFQSAGVGNRVRLSGVLKGSALIDAYAAMDVFAFASCSETQGLVLAEAMAASVPVVALEAPGAREILQDHINGRLLSADAEPAEFVSAICDLLTRCDDTRKEMQSAARRSADHYSISFTTAQMRLFYGKTASSYQRTEFEADNLWTRSRRAISNELDIVGNLAHAVGDAIFHPSAKSNGNK